MNTPEENIKTILADWLDALRRHDFATVERRMDPEIFWWGVREDFACEDRDEAMEMLREQQREEHGVEALDLIATEARVILGIRSTQLQEIGGVPLGGQIFTLGDHDGRIVRVDEYRRRSEALEAAGAEGRGDWLKESAGWGPRRAPGLFLTSICGRSWKLVSRMLRSTPHKILFAPW
jgi:hypothetical protein